MSNSSGIIQCVFPFQSLETVWLILKLGVVIIDIQDSDVEQGTWTKPINYIINCPYLTK